MFTVYWAAKGGAGATVLAAAHGVLSAEVGPTVLVDLDGDLPAALGCPDPDAGVAQWLAAGADAPTDALERLLVPVRDNLHLLPRGPGPLHPARAATLATLLADMPRTVIVDAGTRPAAAAEAVIRSADRSVLVTRACYLAVRRAGAVRLAPSEIALVREPQRALRIADLEEALCAPVRTTVPVGPAIARAVDAGLLAARLPLPLRRPLVRAFR